MPWIYAYDRYLETGIVVASGVLTAEEIVSGFAAALRDPQFSPDQPILFDYLGLVDSPRSLDELLHFRYDRCFSQKSRRALLVGGYFFDRLQRHVATHPGSGQVGVFASRAQAVEWLHEGLPRWKLPV